MIRTTASRLSVESCVVMPRIRPARSDTKNQRLVSIVASQSVSPGMVILVTSATDGDCRCPPPGALVNSSWDRKSVIPGATMLTATPAMMWSTPKVIAAMPIRMPPRAPHTMPKNTPAHGPHW